jgi:hypothetical protein
LVAINNITTMSEQASRDLDQTFQFAENVSKTHLSHTFNGSEIFTKFGWLNAPRSLLAQEQTRLQS